VTATLTLKQRFALSRFFQGEKPSPEPLTLTQRRIFILPTARGMGFVGLIALLLMIALVYNNNLVYLLSFMLASIFFISILHTYQSLSGLVVRASHTLPAFAGEKCGFCFIIQNPQNQPRLDLHIKLETETVIDIPAQDQQQVVLSQQASKRGLLRCGSLTISSTFPLGLFRAWSPLRFDLEALVYPRPVENMAPFPEAEGIQGDNGQGRKGGDDFYGLKSYQPGDSVRQIHWKSYAKGLGLHSKQYGGAVTADLWLDYALAPGHDVEQRLSHLCRWVIEAEQAGLHYGLVLPTTKTVCASGAAHQKECLEVLARF
jgi:uncharacterized protein (DUF58 family)